MSNSNSPENVIINFSSDEEGGDRQITVPVTDARVRADARTNLDAHTTGDARTELDARTSANTDAHTETGTHTVGADSLDAEAAHLARLAQSESTVTHQHDELGDIRVDLDYIWGKYAQLFTPIVDTFVKHCKLYTKAVNALFDAEVRLAQFRPPLSLAHKPKTTGDTKLDEQIAQVTARCNQEICILLAESRRVSCIEAKKALIDCKHSLPAAVRHVVQTELVVSPRIDVDELAGRIRSHAECLADAPTPPPGENSTANKPVVTPAPPQQQRQQQPQQQQQQQRKTPRKQQHQQPVTPRQQQQQTPKQHRRRPSNHDVQPTSEQQATTSSARRTQRRRPQQASTPQPVRRSARNAPADR
ncbi:nuclear transcription factor Y subunit beta-like [Sycon ciliatum]|uniref:nuclear transcription factor Y subunit beta-like n=1 Tax=Sycon ciliatum TaxID=27933 RepID=UPI0031F715B2